jgi:presenilin-like A22 family membrane protease
MAIHRSVTRRSGSGLWTIALMSVSAIVGWLAIESGHLVWLEQALGLKTAGPRFIAIHVEAICFGVAGALIEPRRWYLVPLAGISLDWMLMCVDFSKGYTSLAPIAVAIRLEWLAEALAGGYIGPVVRRLLARRRTCEDRAAGIPCSSHSAIAKKPGRP